MRKEVVEVIESARNLQIKILNHEGQARVIMGGSKHDFPDKLKAVALALEAFDRVGSKALDGLYSSASMDPVKLRQALDGIFRWFRVMKMDVDIPHEIVATALGMERASKNTMKPVTKFYDKGFSNSNSGTSVDGKKRNKNMNNDTLREHLRNQINR